MLRQEYWQKSKELIEFCSEEELKVLGQQAAKELNKRMDAYTRKFDASEDHRSKVKKRKTKERAKKRNKT